jgi:hypothetical protein
MMSRQTQLRMLCTGTRDSADASGSVNIRSSSRIGTSPIAVLHAKRERAEMEVAPSAVRFMRGWFGQSRKCRNKYHPV